MQGRLFAVGYMRGLLHALAGRDALQPQISGTAGAAKAAAGGASGGEL